MFQRFCLSFLVCALAASAAPRPEEAAARAKAALAGLPLRFEANEGQWNSEVRYAARSASGTLFLTERGPAMAADGRRVDISLLNGNAAARLEALEQLPVRTNYFVGKPDQWRRGVSNFARVAYRSVYPGIDVVYYGNQDQLEYDFVLQAGADPNAIRIQFRGADRVRLTAEGNLAVESGDARFVQKKPLIYQQDPHTAKRHAVAGRYEVRADGVVRLKLEGYDRGRPLVIDPVVTYATFLGGSSTDVITCVGADGIGYMYVAGYTNSNNLPQAGTQVQAGYATGLDGFVAVLDPNFTGPQTLVYLTYLGGSRDDSITAMRVDPTGVIYVTGTTTSSDFPLAGANVQTTLALSASSTSSVFPTDAFVTILSTQGLQYSTYYGGTGNETPHGITVDGQGFIYILGTTTSTDLPATANAYSSGLSGPSDIFLAEIDRNSTTLVYGSYLGGEGSDDGRGVAVGSNGLVYFVASTNSQAFPITGPSYRNALSGFENLAIGILDLTQPGTNSLIYSTYLGGSMVDEARQMKLDSKGKLLITGYTLSPDFPVTLTAMQPQYGGNGNAFVIRVNPGAPAASFLEYSTYLGGSGGDVGYDMVSDATGAIYATGYTLSSNFPVTADAVQGFGKGIEAFLVKFDPTVSGSAALRYGTYLGGTGVNVGNGIAFLPNGNIFMGGYTSGDFSVPTLQNSFNGGASDGFIVVFQQTPVAPTRPSITNRRPTRRFDSVAESSSRLE